MHIDGQLKRKRRLSMTSLIDVIFLLLLFFMLSSTFTRFAEIDIAAGRGGQTPTAAAPDVFIRLDGERGWKVNGAAMPTDVAITELRRLEGDGAKSALVIVRENVSSQMLVEALEKIAGEVNLKISVAG